MRNIGVSEYLKTEAVQVEGPRGVRAEALIGVIKSQTPVAHEDELLRVFGNYDAKNFKDYFNQAIGALTIDEFDHLQKTIGRLFDLVDHNPSRLCLPNTELLHSFNIFRHLQMMFHHCKPKVLEIGGGPGYLGCLLNQAGYSYLGCDACTDNYLAQNHFFNSFSQGKLKENFFEKRESQSDYCSVSLSHTPWWALESLAEYEEPAVEVLLFNRDVWTQEPQLINWWLEGGFKHFDRSAYANGLVVLAGSRDVDPARRLATMQNFADKGLVLIHSDLDITVFSMPGKTAAVDGINQIHSTDYLVETNPYSNAIRFGGKDEIGKRIIEFEQIETLFLALEASFVLSQQRAG